MSFVRPMLSRITRNLTISSNTSDYNIEFVLGGPTGTVHVVLRIDPGVIVSASSVAIPALATGDLVVGSTLRIVNNGQIIGMGGIGGKGGDIDARVPTNGDPGTLAGPAMDIRIDTDIVNANGDLFGGGGGGGGGGAGSVLAGGSVPDCHSGGGGGGGAGAAVKAGGARGNATNCTFLTNGSAGLPSTPTAAGSGGAGAPPHSGCTTGNGGAGGEYGQAGQLGADSVGCTDSSSLGGAGGVAGKACELNGNTLTFISGNNPSQVKGDVS